MPIGIKGFQKGNQAAKGRVSRKNLLPIIRDKVLRSLNARISELETVDVEELLAFARTIMPKDINMNASPSITFITNCPRPIETLSTANATANATTTMTITSNATAPALPLHIAQQSESDDDSQKGNDGPVPPAP